MCLQGALGSCGQRMTASLKFSQRSLCCAPGLSGNVQKYTQKNGPPISACTVHVTSCSLRGEMREMLAVTYDPTTEFMYWTCLDRLVTAGVEAGVPDSQGGLDSQDYKEVLLKKGGFHHSDAVIIYRDWMWKQEESHQTRCQETERDRQEDILFSSLRVWSLCGSKATTLLARSLSLCTGDKWCCPAW